MIPKHPWRSIYLSSLVAAGSAALSFFFAIPFDKHVAVLVRKFPDEAKAPFAVLSGATEPVLVLPLMACALVMIILISGRRGLTKPGMVTGLCLISATLALLLTFLGKVPIGRARPQISAEWDPLLFKPFAGSYVYESLPSAQAAMIAAICLCIASRVPGRRLIALPVALLVSLSRVVIERHWLSDVLAGWVVGGLAALASVLLLSRFLDDGTRDM
ncbi:phosphatase PAP2 family protein [Microvirga roseola]|uniref:phosphatase PAP2 family protein n=1 Tax=Microvirga roseola TaxID=2883126 RepID=UPI001E44FAA5|nr:phosphatase PAP2 family protein [Microvirga roseola]